MRDFTPWFTACVGTNTSSPICNLKSVCFLNSPSPEAMTSIRRGEMIVMLSISAHVATPSSPYKSNMRMPTGTIEPFVIGRLVFFINQLINAHTHTHTHPRSKQAGLCTAPRTLLLIAAHNSHYTRVLVRQRSSVRRWPQLFSTFSKKPI